MAAVMIYSPIKAKPSDCELEAIEESACQMVADLTGRAVAGVVGDADVRSDAELIKVAPPLLE